MVTFDFRLNMAILSMHNEKYVLQPLLYVLFSHCGLGCGADTMFHATYFYLV